MLSVCAIMPTRGRPTFARHALRSFLEQDWPNKWLVILDDLIEPSFIKEPKHPAIIYGRLSSRNIAEKRNHCCSVMTADIFIHFDDDDWSAPGRIREQIERMQREQKAVSGYSTAWFYVEQSHEWRLWTARHGAPYVIGTSLAYTREWWEKYPFETNIGHQGVGEDNHMNGLARDGDQISTAEGTDFIVARAHPGNTCNKMPSLDGWPLMPRPAIADLWEAQLAT